MRTRSNGPDRPGPDRRFALAPDLVSGGYEATAGIPRLRLPTGFEVIGCLRRAAPSFSAFDRTAAGRPEGTGMVHSTFNECGRPATVCWGRCRRCGSRFLCGEGIGVFGPYDGRRGCRPRRDRGRFRDDGGCRGPGRSGRWCGRGGGGRAHPPFSRWSPPRFLRHGNRCPTPIRSNRAPPPPPAHHVSHDRIVQFASHFGDTPSVRAGKQGADRGYVRRPLRTGNAPDRPVIPAGVRIAQPPASDDRVRNRRHHDRAAAANGIGPRVAEASRQPFPDAGDGEDVPEGDGFRMRCRVPRLKPSGNADTSKGPQREPDGRSGRERATAPASRGRSPDHGPGPGVSSGGLDGGIPAARGRGASGRRHPAAGRCVRRARGRHCRCRRTGTPQGRHRASHTGRCARTARPAAVRTDHPQAPCGVGDIAAKA